ncbi:hypothetical protein GEV33_008001 [Tenebrio molitor]|uniref:Uncharacterized protein n=1 Tax=Tenebrio molitor TaxID=7067 RepID=A0A8J6LBA4_TENMO|nr:hypothetical protein GEV33_008001 [Tenebrio molitor]
MDELWGGGGPDPLNPPLLSTPLLLYTTLAETKHFDTGATAQRACPLLEGRRAAERVQSPPKKLPPRCSRERPHLRLQPLLPPLSIVKAWRIVSRKSNRPSSFIRVMSTDKLTVDYILINVPQVFSVRPRSGRMHQQSHLPQMPRKPPAKPMPRERALLLLLQRPPPCMVARVPEFQTDPSD